jgi:hypothetical protein
MPTLPSKPKPVPSPPSDEEIIELRPPAAFGFSGTAKFFALAQAKLVDELLKRGYTKVER